MNDEDYLHLIEVIKEQLVQANLGHIADDENYLNSPVDSFGEGEEDDQLPEPRKHLHLLLEAFSTHMALNDRRTVLTALTKINGITRNQGPKSACIQTLRRAGRVFDGELPQEISLLELPDLTELREELRKISLEIIEGRSIFGAEE
jgi:hypothetical protein